MRAFIVIFSLFMLFLPIHSAMAETKVLQLCTQSGFEPYVIKHKNSLTGIDIDIIVQILKDLKQPGEIKAYPWKRMVSLLKSGECDLAFSLFDTQSRREFASFIFTVPMHYSTFSVFVRQDKMFRFNKISDFFGLKVAHNRGYALTIGFEQAIADHRLERVFFDDAQYAIKMLEAGRIDAILDNEARFRYYLKKHNKLGTIKSLSIPFMPHRPAFLALSRNSKLMQPLTLKKKVERELRKLHLNGTILKITTKYLN